MEALVRALRSSLLSVGVLAAILPAARGQQRPADRAAAPALGSVAGEVFDSLIGATLEGARIQV